MLVNNLTVGQCFILNKTERQVTHCDLSKDAIWHIFIGTTWQPIFFRKKNLDTKIG